MMFLTPVFLLPDARPRRVHFILYNPLAQMRDAIRLPLLGDSVAPGGRDAGATVVEALRDVSLDLREGDRLGLVGHNGAGTSTLLRVLAGVCPPTTGR